MWSCPKCGEEIEDQFDSCWKCAGAMQGIAVSAPKQSLRWFHYVMACAAAYLMPLFGSIIGCALLPHTWGHRTLFSNGIEVFRDPVLWLLLAVPAPITFLVLWPFLNSRILRRVVYALLSLFWMYFLQPA
jgi:hypothetical protein